MRAWGMYAAQRPLRRAGVATMHSLGLQIVLGLAAFFVVPKTMREAGEAIPGPIDALRIVVSARGFTRLLIDSVELGAP